MMTISPGFDATTSNALAFSLVYMVFTEAPGTLDYNSGQNIGGIEPQNNFTINDIVENDGTWNQFYYAYPINAEDRRGGRVCSVTGYWAPKRFITYVDGRPMIKAFARKPILSRYQKKRVPPARWGG